MKISKIKDYAMVGGVGVAVAFALAGCDNSASGSKMGSSDSRVLQNAQKNGAFVVIEEQNDGSYKILEEYPSDTTRVMLKDKNGNERMLSQGEIDELLAEEERKIDNGTSELTAPGGGGLGLGGAILASAAGAILGSYIGNKLFNNQNFQQNAQRNYKSPQAYERSKNSFNNAKSGSAGTSATRAGGANAGAGGNAGKSGFYGNQGGTGGAGAKGANPGTSAAS